MTNKEYIEEYFKDKPYKEDLLAELQSRLEQPAYETNLRCRFISGSFIWSTSKRGAEYWEKIHDSLLGTEEDKI